MLTMWNIIRVDGFCIQAGQLYHFKKKELKGLCKQETMAW